ncbi:MAG: glucoamylase family protein [Verrucomicrobiia bacterium]
MKLHINPSAGSFRRHQRQDGRTNGPFLNFQLLALAGTLLMAASPTQAGNLLINPGFEANSGHVVAAGWTYFSPPPPPGYFGDYWVESAVTPHSGTYYWKQWGALYLSAPTNNVAGIYQNFSSAPGAVYQASGWLYTSAGDILGAGCETWIQVEFLDANTNVLALYKSSNFFAGVGVNTWFPYSVTNACDLTSPVSTGDPYFTTYAVTGSVSQLVAPLGTATVSYRYAYLQAGINGGSAYLDDAVLDQVSGPTNSSTPPTGLVILSGDKSVILHWDPDAEINLSGYNVYRSLSGGGPFVLQNTGLLTSPGFCDLNVTNGQTYFYRVTAVTTAAQESLPSTTLSAVPNPFASDDAFLDYVQQANFDYFWYAANPANGLVPDRTATGSACSIAAEGFGLTAIGIGIDHGWISRTQGAARVLTTLNTFLNGPQGAGASGTIGYNGWFYHFLDMNTALRAPNSELSSIDTTLLLAGILYAKQYFNGPNSDETSIRTMADTIFNRVDWNWMAQGTSAVSMGWFPSGSFIGNNWIGYNEGMILYILGLGIATNPLPAAAWTYWTSGYTWATNYGQAYIPFPPLFGYQYSHCWIDFRHIADAYMNSQNSTYCENSRRATLAQRQYCIANPSGQTGYGSNVWGLTACDDPYVGYEAHGAPPAQNDDGTIAPTAPGGAMAFTPEYSLPNLEYLYNQYRTNLWTANGFRDAFNLGVPWFDTDELGIDQGPIVIMIENYRTQRPWRLFMQNAEVQRGLQRAGFVSLPFVALTVQALTNENTVTLTWDSQAGRTYQVEYSPDLATWFASPSGEVTATGTTASWTDAGPPGTLALPSSVPHRFYRVFQFGSP